MQGSTQRSRTQILGGCLLVGVDPHQAQHAVVVMTPDGQRLTKFKVPTTRAGFVSLQSRVATAVAHQDAPGAVYGVEAGGHYWRTLVTFLDEAGETVRLVNPFTLKRRREGTDLNRRKNDFRDAAAAAELLRTGTFTETRPPQGVYADLRASYARYRRLQVQRTRAINLLRALLDTQFPEFRLVFKDVLGQTAVAVLKVSTNPRELAALTPDVLVRKVRAVFQGRRLMGKKVAAVQELAAHTVGVAPGASSVAAELQDVLEQLEVLQAQVQRAAAQVVRLVEQTPEYRWLQTMRGVGPLLLAGLLGETGPLGQYQSPRALIKLAGTNPTEAESAGKASRHTPMSKKGRPRLRHALWLIAVQLLRHDASFRQWAAGLQQRSRHPLQRREAIGAVANRFLRVAFALVRDRAVYCPEQHGFKEEVAA